MTKKGGFVSRRTEAVLISTALIWFSSGSTAQAYIGPGAGFAFVSTFFILFLSISLTFLTLFTWPIRWFIKSLLRKKRAPSKRAKKVIIVGLDGQDPELTEQFMDAGALPHFAQLREAGTFARLKTTLPAESPVAWSSFQTGCNPGKHSIYDFLVPNRKSMLPELSSSTVSASTRTLNLGRYKIPLGKPAMRVGRKSKPFWSILGEYGVFSTVLRVPLTFPPEKFHGALLSAMCLPDIKGSQGTYFYYTSDPDEKRTLTSGIQLPLEVKEGIVHGWISGPENLLVRDGGEVNIPFTLHLNNQTSCDAELVIGKERWQLQKKEYSPWLCLSFPLGLGMSVRGLTRCMLLETSPFVKLYMTPIQIDPEKPALPISHPFVYSVYLAKNQGPFATLGVAEDTSALNEDVIDEEAFLAQCNTIHKEREQMFFDALEKTSEGLTVCVFDITDRIQHMFFRYDDENHPALRGKPVEPYRHVIPDLYRDMDNLIGRVMEQIDDETILIVMSDHGFKPFRRCVDLNAWLNQNGYLSIRQEGGATDMLQNVDWSTTRAYAVGFGGIYLNLVGREIHGTVQPGDEAEQLKKEISEKLVALYDEQEDLHPVREVYDRNEAYTGPYTKDAPDLVVGFRVGYRVAWQAVTGGIGDTVLEDNTRPWSGDHNMNPADVPGMFFCNRAIEAQEADIVDIAPTVLDLFGVTKPAHMDGRSLKVDTNSKVQPNGSTPDSSKRGTEVER